MVAKAEQLERIVRELRQLPNVIGAVLVSRGGIVITASASEEAHAETFAAMGATMSGAASAALSEFNKTGPDRIVVEGRECVLVAVDAGTKAILVVLKEGRDGVEQLLSSAEVASRLIKETLS
jgi:predicted regulator of Ras-like GTPase activity (Roadblock/LC7/MglB family)